MSGEDEITLSHIAIDYKAVLMYHEYIPNK